MLWAQLYLANITIWTNFTFFFKGSNINQTHSLEL